MKTIKIESRTYGLTVSSTLPRFKYHFGKEGLVFEVPENHAKKILKNDNFFISDKPIKKNKKVSQIKPKEQKPWLEELEEIKGIGKETASDISAVYPNKGSLLEAISIKAKIPFRNDVVKKLKKEFIH